MTYPSEVLSDSPIAYWRLGETSGNALDSAGANPLAYSGTPVQGVVGLLTGDANLAVNLATAYISGSSVTLPAGAISVEAWAKISSYPGDGAILSQYTGSGVLLMLSSNAPGLIYFYINGNQVNVAWPDITNRHHVVATWDGTNSRIYLDGALAIGPTAMAGPLVSPAVPLQIGAYSNGAGTRIPGIVDEVAYYPVALSAARISAHYTAGVAAGRAPSGVGRYDTPSGVGRYDTPSGVAL